MGRLIRRQDDLDEIAPRSSRCRGRRAADDEVMSPKYARDARSAASCKNRIRSVS